MLGIITAQLTALCNHAECSQYGQYCWNYGLNGGEFLETQSQYTVTTSIKSFGLCEKSADWIFQKFRLEKK